jgi:uncharacterized linocin/CFP29 family protein
MTNLLRRSLAPLTDRAWEEVDARAKQVLKTQLSARRIVDIDGPHGWQLAAIDTGRLRLADRESSEGVPWGVRQVLPLLELRLPFILRQMELDAISRGCNDPDLETLEDAAKVAAQFEESVIFHGLPDAHIQGIMEAAQHDSVALPEDPLQYPSAIAQAFELLHSAGIPQPYLLVLGRIPYFRLLQAGGGDYPPHRLIENMIDVPIRLSPALTGGAVVSAAPGNFQLTIGQDWSIGYASHDRDEVELYITESFTFRVLDSAAIVPLTGTQ